MMFPLFWWTPFPYLNPSHGIPFNGTLDAADFSISDDSSTCWITLMSKNIRFSQINLQDATVQLLPLGARFAKLQDRTIYFFWYKGNFYGYTKSEVFYNERSSKPEASVPMSNLLKAVMMRRFCSQVLAVVQVNSKWKSIIVAYMQSPLFCVLQRCKN